MIDEYQSPKSYDLGNLIPYNNFLESSSTKMVEVNGIEPMTS